MLQRAEKITCLRYFYRILDKKLFLGFPWAKGSSRNCDNYVYKTLSPKYAVCVYCFVYMLFSPFLQATCKPTFISLF